MPPIGLPDRIAGAPAFGADCARAPLGARSNLTCAHPTARGRDRWLGRRRAGRAAAAAPARATTARSRRCRRARSRSRRRSTPSCARWARPIARHVERGFETLVVSTARAHALRRRAPRDGRRGAHPGRRPIRASRGRPGSPACRSAAPTATARARRGLLVIRRPLPARGEHQIAHVYLPQACNGTPEHFRFALPDAESARDQSARAAVLGRRVRAPRRAAAPGASSRSRACASSIPKPAAKAVADAGRSRATPGGARRRGARREGDGQAKPAGQAGAGGARRGARDGAAARAVGAGAPDGHHDRDDVAAGDAADRSRAARRRRTKPRRCRCRS